MRLVRIEMDKFVIRTPRSKNPPTETLQLNVTEIVQKKTGDKEISNQHESLLKLGNINLYQNDYLAFGFTFKYPLKDDYPLPLCLLCGAEYSNRNMCLSFLSKHLHEKHAQFVGRPKEYFSELLKIQRSQEHEYTRYLAEFDDSEKTMDLMNKSLLDKIIEVETFADVLLPETDVTISDHGQPDCAELRDFMFGLQVNTVSKDISTVQVIVSIRCIRDASIVERFLCIFEINKEDNEDILFDILNEKLINFNLNWNNCVGINTEEIRISKTAYMKNVIARAKSINPDIIISHSFLDTDLLINLSVPEDYHKVQKDIEYIMEWNRDIVDRPYNSEIIFEQVERLKNYFWEQNINDFYTLLSDRKWLSKLAYLLDIYEFLKNWIMELNCNDQNILKLADKLLAMKEKILYWMAIVRGGGNTEVILRRTSYFSEEEIRFENLCDNLEMLLKVIDYYQPNIYIVDYDWIRNPFVKSPDTNNPIVRHTEELIELRNNRDLMLQFESMSQHGFWISLQASYPLIAKEALRLLLNFSTTVLYDLIIANLKSINSQGTYSNDEINLKMCELSLEIK